MKFIFFKFFQNDHLLGGGDVWAYLFYKKKNKNNSKLVSSLE